MPRAAMRGIFSAGLLLVMALPAACSFEDRPRSLVQELRVVSGRVQPPEVAFPAFTWEDPEALNFRAHLDVDLLLVDPAHPDATLDVSVVACTEVSGICLESLQYQFAGAPYVDDEGLPTEAAYRDILTRHSWRGQATLSDISGEVSLKLDTYEGWPLYLQQLGMVEAEAHLMILACVADTCPVFDDLDAYLADEDASGGEAIIKRLAHKEAATEGLALGSHTLARKIYKASTRDDDLANTNPEIDDVLIAGLSALGDAPVLQSNQSVVVQMPLASFQPIYTDGQVLGYEALTVSLMSSAGVVAPAMQQVSYIVGESQATWELAAPGAAYLWVMVRDARGGMSWVEVKGQP